MNAAYTLTGTNDVAPAGAKIKSRVIFTFSDYDGFAVEVFSEADKGISDEPYTHLDHSMVLDKQDIVGLYHYLCSCLGKEPN